MRRQDAPLGGPVRSAEGEVQGTREALHTSMIAFSIVVSFLHPVSVTT